jgi:hypothetical protein
LAYSFTRRRIFEQANVVTIFVTVTVSAVLYGWIEGTLYPYYPYKEQFVFAGHLTYYHAVFFALFLVIGFTFSLSRTFSSGLRYYYLLFASLGSVMWGFWIEDMSYFSTRYPDETLMPGVWVEWGLSGIYFAGHWIPWVYVFLCSGGFCIFGFAFLTAKRDLAAYEMLRTIGPKTLGNLIARSVLVSREFARLLSTHYALIISFSLIVQLANIVGASLTNIGLPLHVDARLALLGFTVVIFPLMLLLAMDHLSSVNPASSGNT